MEYLLKSSAVIAIFYVCYKLFLQRDTFFESNRWFLLIGLITAFALPFVVIPIYIEYTPAPIQDFVINETSVMPEVISEPISIWEYIFAGYLIGAALFLIRFCVQISSLAILITKSKKQKKNGYTFVESVNNTAPFSFFRWMVYNPNQYKNSELELIITHEKVHVKQYHSIDILLSQLAAIVFWFNPITWFYKKDLQQNLEFIADYKAQNSTSCKKSYQHLLLKTSLPNQHMALTNNFYNSLIKKRIVMLHKSKSKKINLLKYTLVLPFLALFLMGFNTEEVYVEKVLEDNNLTDKKELLNNLDLIEINPENKYNLTEIENKETLIKANTEKHQKAETNKKEAIKINKLEMTISGTVTNTEGKGLPGTNIIIKGTTTGTVSDFDGNYTIKASKGEVLIFSYIGMVTKEVKIAKKTEINVVLSPKKINAISNNDHDPLYILDGKEISKTELESISPDDIYALNVLKNANETKLYGKKGENGVVIITSKNSNSTPRFYQGNKTVSTDSIYFDRNTITTDTISWKTAIGHPTPNTKILGNSLLTNGEKPLYILDDVEVPESRIQNLEKNKIASISVLKDQSATVLYGKKSKDGVIIITTKKDWNTGFKVGKPLNSKSNQEEFIVSGTVTHDFGPEIQDAMVIIEEKQRGVSTNAKGEYKIKAAKGDKLSFSKKNLVSKEVIVNADKAINVKLSSHNGFAVNAMNPKKPIYYIYGKEVSKKEYRKKFQDMLKQAKKEHDNKSKEVTPVISGIITDKKGKPIQGAMVLNGETIGVMTNAKGEYRIKAVKGDKLTYSFKDMASQEIEVKENKTIDVKLRKKTN